MKILIRNIKELFKRKRTCPEARGKEMSVLKRSKMHVTDDGECIKDFGEREICSCCWDDHLTMINGKMCSQFCDSHTHLVYAEAARLKYIDKIRGWAMRRLQEGWHLIRQTPAWNLEEELVSQALARCMKYDAGTGAVESKADTDWMWKTIENAPVIRKLKDLTPLTLCPLFWKLMHPVRI